MIDRTGLRSCPAGAVVIDFESLALSDGDMVTNEYAALGINLKSKNFIANDSAHAFPGRGGDWFLVNFPSIDFTSDVDLSSLTAQIFVTVESTLFFYDGSNTLIHSIDIVSNFEFETFSWAGGFRRVVLQEMNGGLTSNVIGIDDIVLTTAVPLPSAGALGLLGLIAISGPATRRRVR